MERRCYLTREKGVGVFRTAEHQLSGDTHNTRKSAEKAHKTSIISVRAAAQLTNNQRVPWMKLEAHDTRTEGVDRLFFFRAAAQITNNQRVPWIKLEACDTRTEGINRLFFSYHDHNKVEGKAASRPRHAGDFPTEYHTRASLLGKLSAGFCQPCSRAG